MAHQEAESDSLSQAAYEETPYKDSSWELVGEQVFSEDFVPMHAEVIEEEFVTVDPMFADYGGIPQEKSEKRWHLPGDLAFRAPEDKQEKEEENLSAITMQEEDLEKIRQEAFEQGKQQALEEAAEKQSQRLSELEERTKELFVDMMRQVQERIEDIEKQAVELSLSIAEKLVAQAVEINPEYIIQIINEAIGQSGSALIRTVRVSKEDLEFIDVLGVRKHIAGFDGTWDFEADESITSGCIVETTAGEIDYQIDQAWDRIRENVMKVAR